MGEVRAIDFLAMAVKVSQNVGWQAGVGGMETAGAIISYLGKFPERLPDFMREGFDALPARMHEQGCLTWHGMNGKVVSPEFARRQRVVKSLEKGSPNATR